MSIYIFQGENLNLFDCLPADFFYHIKGQSIITYIHQPLGNGCYADHNRHADQYLNNRAKIHQTFPDDMVDSTPGKNWQIQRQNNRDRCHHNRHGKKDPVMSDIRKYFFDNLFIHKS